MRIFVIIDIAVIAKNKTNKTKTQGYLYNNLNLMLLK